MSLQSSQAPAIVLASSSRVRASLLDSAGLAFTVDKASVDEGSVRDSLKAEGAPAEHAAELLAEMKAISVSGRHPGSRQHATAGGAAASPGAGDARSDGQRAGATGRPKFGTRLSCMTA